MRRLRQEAVEERMKSIEIPLLQFDEDEFNPKPIIFDMEFNTNKTILASVKSLNDQTEKKPSKIIETSDLFKLKDIDPKSEWKNHMIQEINFDITNESNIKEDNYNDEKIDICPDNIKFNSIKNLATVEDNSISNYGEDLPKTKDNSIISIKKDLTMANTNKLTSEETSLIQINYIQDSIDTIRISTEHLLLDNINNVSNDTLNLEDGSNEKSKFKNENDTEISQIYTSLMYSSEGKNVDLSIESKIDKKQKNPMYLYPSNSDDGVPPIPRFLSSSKVSKPRILIQYKTNELSKHLLDSIDFKSEPTSTDNQCFKAKTSRAFSKIEQGLENHQTSDNRGLQSNNEIEHIDSFTKESLFKLDSLQKCNVDKAQENMLNDIFLNLERMFLTTIDFGIEFKNNDTSQNQNNNLEGKLDTPFQRQIMNRESNNAKIEVDEKTFLADITNASHLNLQQNIPSFTMSTPCFLNFQKTKDCEWKFDDIPSRVSIEIKNINDETKMNCEYDVFNDHGMVHRPENYVHEEWIKHITTIESSCEDSKINEDKSNICIGIEPSIKDEELKKDFSACLECDLINRMNHNLHHGHQQVGTFYATCTKQSQDNLIIPHNYSKATQHKCDSLLMKKYNVSFYQLKVKCYLDFLEFLILRFYNYTIKI